jgi:hypothetical protein
MKLRFLLTVSLAVLLMILCSAPSAFAQASIGFAQLNGNVTDESGRAVVKAAITLTELNTNKRSSAATNDTGYYVVPNLFPGKYELTVEASGLGKYLQTGILLLVGQTATIDVTMKVATVHETVQVTAEAPPVEPTRTDISQVIDTKEIQQLPTNGRQFVDFALLTPGVATGRTSIQSTFTEPEVTRISFGGMRDLSNAVTVNGADYINESTGSQRATPSQEAVAEFRVLNNSFGAEYGRALGGIVNVITKSGSNTFHGSVYGYLSNNAWNAMSELTLPQFDAYRRGQFGGTLGGPIKKDKTFFFMNYEGERFAQSPTYPTTLVTNLASINAAKVAMGIAPENLNVLKTINSDNGFIRLDHEFNANNRLTLHYGIVDARDLNVLVGDTLDGGGLGAPSSGHNTFLRDQSLVGTVNTLLTPNLTNTALVQYARRHYNFPGVTGEPNLDIPNTLLFGHNFGTFDAIDETRVQFTDSLAWIKGNHYFRFGGDLNYVNNFVIWPGFTPMRIIVPGINCLLDFARFVNQTAVLPENPANGPCPTSNPPFFPPTDVGPNPNDGLNGVPIVFWGAPVGSGPIVPGSLPPPIPTTWQNAYVNPQDYYVYLNHSYIGFYAQDQWRLTSKLTMNYGLRWDFEGGLSGIIKPDYGGWQPRIGFAYSPTKHTVIRAGFGIFDDHYNMTFFFVTHPQRDVVIPNFTMPGLRDGNASATWVLNQLGVDGLGLPYPGPTPYNPGNAPTVPFPSVAAARLVTTGQNPPNFNTGPGPGQDPAFPAGTFVTNSGGGIDRTFKIAYSEQASLQIDQEIGKGLVISAGYLFLRAHHQIRPQNLNVCPNAGTITPATICPPASAVPGPPITPFGPFPGGTLADGKQGFFGQQFQNAGLMYFLDSTGNAAYDGGTISVSDRWGQYLRFAANYTWSHTRDDGTFTTFVSTPQNEYNRGLERADSVQDVRQRFVANFTADAPQQSWIRNFQFNGIVTLQTPRPFTIFVGNDVNGDTNPVTDRVGNSPRNSYRGDDFYAVDLRLSRLIHLNERLGLLLAVDAFNVFNRANVNEVTSVYGGGTIDFCGATPKRFHDAASVAIQQGLVTCNGAINGGAPAPNPLFGTPRTMFNPRQLQFSAKFTF